MMKKKKKIILEDVIGMVKKEDEVSDDWDIDKAVYLEED